MARTTVATDAFTGTDATDLVTYGGWARIRDTVYGSSARIAGNKCVGYFAADSPTANTALDKGVVMVRSAGTYTADQYVKFTMGGFAFNGYQHKVGAVMRCSTDLDAAADFYAIWVCDEDAGSGASTIIVRVNNGTVSVLDNRRLTWANGDSGECEITGTGATVTLTPYKNGAALGYTISDSDASRIVTSDRPGLFIAGRSGTGDGPLSVTIDDWEGGNVSTGGFFARAYYDMLIG